MTHRLIGFLFVLLTVSSAAFATCEPDLIAEFSRTPNDSKQGWITDQVPINTAALIASYGMGIFPWSVTEQSMGRWYSPPTRGIVDFSNMEIPRSDLRDIRKLKNKGIYTVKFDTDFRQVITSCAQQARKDGGWITDTHIEEFVKLHQAGYAHSVEVWKGDEMVGGLYGVFVNGFFSGESMFHKESNVTKMAFAALIERMKANGHSFMDAQQVTETGLTKKWGGFYISREEFQTRLRQAAIENNPF